MPTTRTPSTRKATSLYVEVAGWESVTKAGGKKYFRPRFKILGYVKDLEEQFAGAINNDDADAD